MSLACSNRDEMQKMKNLGSIGSSGRLSTEECEDEEVSKLALSTFQAKEEEIERKKMEVREKVELQLGRAEEETRRLAHIWEVSSLTRRTSVIILFSFFALLERMSKTLCEEREGKIKRRIQS